MKQKTKVDPKDVLIYFVCDNKTCDEYGTVVTTYPDDNEQIICECCDEVMNFDHVSVMMEK